MAVSEKTDKLGSQTLMFRAAWKANIDKLKILVYVIAGLGIFGAVMVGFFLPNSHWMEGPAIAVMVVFIPLTAVSYLRFRLPKKQDEFEVIKRQLHFEEENSELFTAMFGEDRSESDYVLPICFVSFFSILGFYILFANNALVLFNGMQWINEALADSRLQGQVSYRRGVVAIGSAFLGAYLWSILYIFRRMMTLDLPPGAYYSIGSRMMYSAFLAVIFQHFVVNASEAGSAALAGQLIPISFLVGIFPERALSWMKESMGRAFRKRDNSAHTLPLEMLEGISSFHKARLSELGIDNVQNLAQASLMELILKTPFNPRVLIDWMAQARMCLEFKDQTKQIRGAGIRTIFDLLEIAGNGPLIAALSENSGVDQAIITTVIEVNSEEKSIARLRRAYDILNVI